jgi:hypothetical protein
VKKGTTMKIEEIDAVIAQLGPAERDAACGRYTFSGPMEQEEGEGRLRELGIWGRGGALTELGKAVRRRLGCPARV